MDKKALSERDIRQAGNVSGDEPHAATDAFDFVLANPPFSESDAVVQQRQFCVPLDVHSLGDDHARFL